MRKVLRMYKRDGIISVFDALSERLQSRYIQQKYGYPEDFIIGTGMVWRTGFYAQVGRGLRIGKRCRIEVIDEHNGITYLPRLTIGDNVSMNDDVHIGCVSSVSIGNNVLMASKIYISDHNHGTYSGTRQDSPLVPPGDRLLGYAPVIIEDNVWIGEMVSILPGVRIGRGSIVGAGSVVSRDIPQLTIAVGSPAHPIKSYDPTLKLWRRIDVPWEGK